MKTFTIGQDLEIDIHRHVRVDGSRFPAPDPDYVADYFIIVARWQGNTINFYPNEGKRSEPLAVGWVGRKARPVYENQGTEEQPNYVQIGTVRGADFRRRMFKMLAHRLGKAILARQLGVTIGQVTQGDIDAVTAPRLRAALWGTFGDPVDLTQFSLDDACRFIRDSEGALEYGEKPPGTVANIDCDYDAHTSSSTKTDNGTTVIAGDIGGIDFRAAYRFPLSAISTATSINDVQIQVNVTDVGGLDAGDTITFTRYGGAGDDDPSSDSANTMFGNCNPGGGTLVSLTNWNSTGSKTTDLGTTADSDVLGNLSSPGWYSVGHTGSISTGEGIRIEAIENTGSDPATLVVDYTEAAGSTVRRQLLLTGVGM